LEKKKCFKCKGEPDYAYRNGLKVCKDCFKFRIIETKFRGALRKDLKVKGKDGNDILILLSGGMNSTNLAYMAGESLNGSTFSKR
jgi:tRNA(Ile)-lysidine synthase TilS/MesJ